MCSQNTSSFCRNTESMTPGLSPQSTTTFARSLFLTIFGCPPCQKYRASLRSQLSSLRKAEVHSEARTDPHSCTNLKSLTKEELACRLLSLMLCKQAQPKSLCMSKAKLSATIESSGHIVDDQSHADLTKMVERYSSDVISHQLPGLFPWEQQLEASRQKGCIGIHS